MLLCEICVQGKKLTKKTSSPRSGGTKGTAGLPRRPQETRAHECQVITMSPYVVMTTWGCLHGYLSSLVRRTRMLFY